MSSVFIMTFSILCLQTISLNADDKKGKTAELPKVALILGYNSSPEATVIQNVLGNILEKKGFFQVERNQMDKLFSEVELNFSSGNETPSKSKNWLGAGILILIGDNAKDKSVSVIAMETETGNELAKIAVPAKTKSSGLNNNLKDFANSISKILQEESRNLPTATVLYVTDNSKSLRLHQFQSQIETQIEKLLVEKGYRLLQRKRTFRLSEETSLSFAGFMDPNFAVLPKPCDLGVSINYEEKPSDKLDYEHTPVSVSVDLLLGAESKNFSLTLTPPELSKINEKMADQILPAGEFKQKFMTNPEAAAGKRRIEAKKMLDILLNKTSEPLDARRVELCRRIIYLDPQARDAYYLLTTAIGIGYDRQEVGNYIDSCAEGVSALSNFLNFPDGDLTWRHRAYENLLNTYSRIILYTKKHEKDSPALQFFRNQLIKTEIERIKWIAKTDHSKYTFAFNIIHKIESSDLPPGKYLEFQDWAANLTSENHTIYDFYRATLHLKVAQDFDKVGNYKRAAYNLYRSMLIGGITSEHLNYIGGKELVTKENALRLSKYLDKTQAEVLISKIKALRPSPQDKNNESLNVMYGDFMSILGYNGPDFHTVGIFFKETYRNLKPIKGAKLEAVSMPQAVKHLGKMLPVSGSLWIPSYCIEDYGKISLYSYGPVEKPGWKKILLPDAWLKSLVSAEHFCQSGDNLFWNGRYVPKDSTKKKTQGQSDVPSLSMQSLMVYNLKTGKADSYSLEDGLPSDMIVGISQDKSDPGAIRVTTGKSVVSTEVFFSKSKDGHFYLSEKNWKRTDGCPLTPLSVTFVNDLIFSTEYGEGGIWRGKDGNFTKIIDEKWGCKLPVPDFFRSWPDIPNPSQNHIVVSENRIFITPGGIFYEIDMQGNIVNKWYSDCFVFWEQLGGIIKGNCSLPCLPTSMIQDDINPNLIWLVTQQFDDTNKEPRQFITAYDSKNEKWSNPLKITGKYFFAHPFGYYWYFSGDNTFCRVPKSEWKCNLSFDSKAEPEFIVADTLHGCASKALFKKDFVETEKLLKEAVEKKIAPAMTNDMLGKLQGLKKKY